MKALRLLLLVALLSPSLLLAGWPDVRSGMTPEQVVAVCGQPVYATKSGVYLTWIYENAGEAVFIGGMLRWFTPPRTR